MKSLKRAIIVWQFETLRLIKNAISLKQIPLHKRVRVSPPFSPMNVVDKGEPGRSKKIRARRYSDIVSRKG